MKKYLLVGLLALLPFMAKAETLAGFLDGNMYDQATGQWRCFYLMDGNCYDLNQNILTTRPVGSIVPVVNNPDPLPQIVYTPVYIPQNTGSGSYTTSSVTPAQQSQIQSVIPSCILLAELQNPAVDSSVVLKWSVQNIPSDTVGTIYVSRKVNAGVPDFEFYNKQTDYSGWLVKAGDGSTDMVQGGSTYYQLILGNDISKQHFNSPSASDIVCTAFPK